MVGRVVLDRPAARWTAADVCTPAVFADQRWSYIDLELDPVGNEHGFDYLADEDEFRSAVKAGHIAPAEECIALTAAATIQQAMATREEPFGTTGWDALDFVAELGLPPTT